MKALSVFVFVSLAAAVSFAGFAEGLPVLEGSKAEILSVNLVTKSANFPRSRGATEVHALVRYKGMCNAPTSLVVVTGASFTYSIVETRIPTSPDNANCQAESYAQQDVVVGQIVGPQPQSSDIKVNGVSPK